jgi:hypothetical protein
MISVIKELYIELYWILFGQVQDKKTTAFLDWLLLSVFQIMNIYSIMKVIQRTMNLNVLDFVYSQIWLIMILCVGIIVLNFFVGRIAKPQLREDDKARFVRPRFFVYAILSLVLFCIARFALNGTSSSM